MISVESTNDTINVRIPRAEISAERLEQLLRGLRLEAAVAGTRMTDSEADSIAEEMKADWWNRNSHRFLPPEKPEIPSASGASSSMRTSLFAR
jgi:hypothetical protein